MSGQCSRPVWAAAGAQLAAAITAEKLDKFRNPVQSSCQCLTQPLKPRGVKCKQVAIDDDKSDVDNKNFTASSTKDGLDDNSNIMEISNEEVRRLCDLSTNEINALALYRWLICYPQKLYQRSTERDMHAY